MLLGLPPGFFVVPMSSSSANGFDWDLLRLSSSDSTASATASATSAPREASGESGGVSSKRFPLLTIDSVSNARICAGYVGKGGLKRFCTQVVSSSGGSCSIGGRHITSKFTLSEDTFYIRATNQAAFCYPSYPQALIVDVDERERIRSAYRTQPEWKVYFGDLEAKLSEMISKDPNELFKPPVAVKLDFDPTLSLKTPAKRVIDGYVERIWETDLTPHIDVPKLPTTDTSTEKEFWERASDEWNQPAELIETLKSIHEGFASLSESWPTPFRDIERHFSLVGADLEKVQVAIENLRTDIGKPIPIFEVDSPDIWCAIDHLATTLSDIQGSISSAVDVSSIHKAIKDLQDRQIVLGQAVQELKNQGVTYDQRFNTIGPIIQKLVSQPGSSVSFHSSSADDVNRRLNKLEEVNSDVVLRQVLDRISNLELSRPIGASMISSSSDTDLGIFKDAIAKLNVKLETLERRVVGDGLAIGIYVFQSFEDLRVWMKTHVPNNRYGLFVDVIGLFELFCTDHVDAATAIGTFHSSQRTGFATMYESSLAASMQNVLPTLLGKGSTDGMDTSRFLPGLRDPDKWSHNGVTGLRFKIERELPNVDAQLSAEINTALGDSIEASGLARECLFRSKRFIADLCQFITTDFEFWCGRGYVRIDAWSLVCQSLRRIFEDIHSERVYGRHVKSGDDSQTAAKYVWAVLKAQEKMQDYSKRNFYEHPSVSAVVARHLASNHMKPNDDGKALSLQVKRCESSLNDVLRKFDALESRVSNKLQQGGGGGGNGKKQKGGKGNKDEDN